MIKLLRQIRHQILNNNKVKQPSSPAGRYTLYAIGEILLVVVGILIALQVNNWNEFRKRKVEEHNILSDFKNSFEADLEHEILPLMQRLVKDSGRIENVLDITKKVKLGADPLIKYKGSGIPVLTHELSFNPQVSVYKTLESQGVNLISDKILRNRILEIYNRLYPQIQNGINNKMINIRDYGRPLFRSKIKTLGPGKGFQILDNKIYDDPIFWNFLVTALLNNGSLYKDLEQLQLEVKSIINDIQKTIK